MKKTVVIFFAISLGRLVIACSCPSFDPAQSFEESELVFTGKVTAVHSRVYNENGTKQLAEPYQVFFSVEQTLKGRAKPIQVVTTPRDSASCGFEFKPGVRYAVFARLARQHVKVEAINNKLRVIQCDPNTNLEEKDDPEYSFGLIREEVVEFIESINVRQ